jgi:hypothetical protein
MVSPLSLLIKQLPLLILSVGILKRCSFAGAHLYAIEDYKESLFGSTHKFTLIGLGTGSTPETRDPRRLPKRLGLPKKKDMGLFGHKEKIGCL